MPPADTHSMKTVPPGSTSGARVLRAGASVAIRHPVAGDREELLDLRVRSRERLERWEPKPVDGVSTWGDEWFNRFLAQCRLPTSQRFLVVRVDDGAIAGQVSLGQIYRGPFANAFMGYWIGTGHTRQGFATQAIRLVLEQAFTELRLHRVEANIMPSNVASLAVARSAGFRLEGYSPRYLQINGSWADHTRWAMTIEDFRAQRGAVPQHGQHDHREPTEPIPPDRADFVTLSVPEITPAFIANSPASRR